MGADLEGLGGLSGESLTAPAGRAMATATAMAKSKKRGERRRISTPPYCPALTSGGLNASSTT